MSLPRFRVIVHYLVLSCLFFGRTYRLAVRTGLIARYSAESVT